MARDCYQSSTNWINASRRLKWNDSLRAFQNIHPTGSKYHSGDYRYRSRLFRPKTRAMVRKAEASTAQAFFSNDDVVNITALDDDDPREQASAEIMQRLLQYRLTKTIPWFQTLVGARQDAEVMGICVGKAYWKYSEKYSSTESRPAIHPATGTMFDETGMLHTEDYDIYNKTEDHPWVDLIPPENFRFDPGADWRNPVATSPYTIEIIPMYIIDVKEKIASGEWLPISEGALFSATDLDDDVTRRGRENNRVPGKSHDSWKPRSYDICWVRENIIRHGGQDYQYYSLSGAGELLTLPKPLEEVYLQGIRPYVVGNVVTEAHKVYPSSKVELIKDLQAQTNDVTNLRLDNVKLALNPRQFLSAGLGIDPQDMRVFMPGKTVITSSKTNPAESIAWDRPPDVTGSAYQEQDRLNMDFDELVGGTSNSNIEANRSVYQAVGNMEIMAGNASMIEEYDQRVFAETFVEPIIKHLVKLEQAYETNPVILAIAGKEAQLWQKFGIDQITDDLLKRELTIKVNVGIGATNPKTKLENFATGADLVGKLFGPAAAMGANFEEIVKEVFGLCGYKDGGRFFMPGFDIHQAMQSMQQGKQKPQEDPNQAMALKKMEIDGNMQIEQMKLDQLEKHKATDSQMEERKIQMDAWLAFQQQKAQADQDSLETQNQMALSREKTMNELALKREIEMTKLGVQMHSQNTSQNIEEVRNKDNSPDITKALSPFMDTLGQMVAVHAAPRKQTIQLDNGRTGTVTSESTAKDALGLHSVSDSINKLSQDHANNMVPVIQSAEAITNSLNQQSNILFHAMQAQLQSNSNLADAINKLAKPKKRMALKDDKGNLIGSEETE